MEENLLWVDKYRPKNLKDLVLNSETKKYFKNMLKSKNILNQTFSGPAGIGKSTICKVICNELDAEVLFIPCAVKGNVATAQGELKSFCDALSLDGKPKIVILDEVDASSASQDSSFQKALRNLIESAQTDTRFLLNCNYIEKVIQPIKSRCPVVNLSFDKKDLLVRIKYILDQENIEYDKDSMKDFIESAFKFYPDIRSIINYLQGCCTTGKLIVSEQAISDVEKENFIKDLVEEIKIQNNLLKIREFYCKNKERIQDYVVFSAELYNYFLDNNLITDPDGILKITDILYYIDQCVDKESMFFGLITAIKKYL